MEPFEITIPIAKYEQLKNDSELMFRIKRMLGTLIAEVAEMPPHEAVMLRLKDVEEELKDMGPVEPAPEQENPMDQVDPVDPVDEVKAPQYETLEETAGRPEQNA